MPAAIHIDDSSPADPGSSPTVVSDFPENPSPYLRVTHAGLDLSDWIWNPDAGNEGEWWGAGWFESFGNGGTAGANSSLRVFGFTPTTTRGLNLTGAIRIMRVYGIWSAPRIGNIQVRIGGVSGGRDIPFDGRVLDFSPPRDAGEWLVGDNNTASSLACFVQGQSINGYTFKVEGRRVWRLN